MSENQIANQIIGCAIEVRKALGPGLLESAYKECFFYKFKQQGLVVEKEKPMNFNVVLLKQDIKRVIKGNLTDQTL
ncbi:MAG: GxxExxY protein [Flavobacterium sp.]